MTLEGIKMLKETYHSYPVMEESLTAKEFVKLYKSNKEIIRSAEPIIPKIGSLAYGKIKVKYKYPHYKTL